MPFHHCLAAERLIWCSLIWANLSVCQQTDADVLPIHPPALSKIFAGASPKSVPDIQAMDAHTQRLAEFVKPAVVQLQMGASHGSGVVVSKTGLVLTAAHVVGAPNRQIRVRFSDGREVEGVTLGVNLEHDLSLVRLLEERTWYYLPVSTSKGVIPGLWCAAVGHPGGFDPERGPVFRLGRILDTGELLRTDCQLIGGDSGGPLIDMQGRVIGIHSRIGASLVNNLHISSSSVRDAWKDLTKGVVRRGQSYIGVRGKTDAPECELSEVSAGSPAESAGLRSGDVVTHFSGQRVWNFAELVMLVQMRRPGDRVPLKIVRDGREADLELEIGSRETSENSP
jgi:serine protease Do